MSSLLPWIETSILHHPPLATPHRNPYAIALGLHGADLLDFEPPNEPVLVRNTRRVGVALGCDNTKRRGRLAEAT